VELEGGRDIECDPPPGRIFMVGPSTTFGQLSEAIDVAFARWDRSHLHVFELPDGRMLGFASDDGEDDGWLDHDAFKVTQSFDLVIGSATPSISAMIGAIAVRCSRRSSIRVRSTDLDLSHAHPSRSQVGDRCLTNTGVSVRRHDVLNAARSARDSLTAQPPIASCRKKNSGCGRDTGARIL
jgi:hypothetical protein